MCTTVPDEDFHINSQRKGTNSCNLNMNFVWRKGLVFSVQGPGFSLRDQDSNSVLLGLVTVWGLARGNLAPQISCMISLFHTHEFISECTGHEI